MMRCQARELACLQFRRVTWPGQVGEPTPDAVQDRLLHELGAHRPADDTDVLADYQMLALTVGSRRG
jgi:hypothetical protein